VADTNNTTHWSYFNHHIREGIQNLSSH